MYEQNPFFRFLAQRFRVRAAVAIQASIEAGFAVLVGMAYNPREPLTPIGIISTVFALAHLMAWHSNRKFLAKFSGNTDNL
ncbi:MAG: hypothetical protein KGH88_06515 [Thaumarchaeota archaeon]|nr:hypothetical protein [Nitrososphaerota archaeon]